MFNEGNWLWLFFMDLIKRVKRKRYMQKEMKTSTLLGVRCSKSVRRGELQKIEGPKGKESSEVVQRGPEPSAWVPVLAGDVGQDWYPFCSSILSSESCGETRDTHLTGWG